MKKVITYKNLSNIWVTEGTVVCLSVAKDIANGWINEILLFGALLLVLIELGEYTNQEVCLTL